VPKHFLNYWKAETAKYELGLDEMFDHSGSEQYTRVTTGDTLWTITTWRGGIPILLGRMRVGRITDKANAQRLLGRADIWDATLHAIAEPGTAEPLREVPLGPIAERLRFNSDKDRLNVEDGRVDAQQLRALRELTPESVALLEALWEEGYSAEVAESQEPSRARSGDGGFGPADTNRLVEESACRIVATWYRHEGWECESVERARCGYDLDCRRAGEILHVEVKGVRGHMPGFMLTHAELRRAKTDEAFVVHVVTNALSKNPMTYRFLGSEVIERFAIVPVSHRATPLGDVSSYLVPRPKQLADLAHSSRGCLRGLCDGGPQMGPRGAISHLRR
jgi:hypothetical protein